MKCAECGKKTTWDESFGGENYIVCPKCFQRIREENKTDGIGTLQIIFQKSIDNSKKVRYNKYTNKRKELIKWQIQ